MPIRHRLFLLFALFSAAVLINIFALIFLARSVSSALDLIERVRVRQLITSDMAEKLRDAEAALYRYQLEGERGFVAQFQNQMQGFGDSIERYRSAIISDEEKQWATKLGQAQLDIRNVGDELIRLHDSQAADLQTMITLQTELTRLLLNEVQERRANQPEYQNAVSGMNENARNMLLTVTAYLAAPDEAKRGQFTESAVQFQQHLNRFKNLAETNEDNTWVTQINTRFAKLQELGAQLIRGRDQQQVLLARFSAANFEASQQVIARQIQPLEAQKLSQAQQEVSTAVTTANAISLVIPIAMTLIAGAIVFRLARNMDQNVSALLRGADRVSAGNLQQPVQVRSTDELRRLAEAFNNMMLDLATRERRLKARLAELETLRQVSLHLTSTLNPEKVLETIADSAFNLVEATAVHIFTISEETQSLTLAASAGQDTLTTPRPNNIATIVASTGQSHVVNAIEHKPLFAAEPISNWSAASVAGFPLKLGEQIMGVLYIACDPQRAFTSEDVRILSLLADQATVALRNARLYNALAEREGRVRALMQKMSQIQDEERRLIGLDLHDGLIQIVISANMHLNTLNSLITSKVDPLARQELESSRGLIKQAIDEARRVISVLRPTVVEDFGLTEGLQRYASELCEAEGWKLETYITLENGTLNPSAESAIFRIAQEALANTRKHSNTKAIKVVLTQDHADVILSVQDWGDGFDPQALVNEADHLGLVSMHERARMLGGVCEITSQPKQGTTVLIRVPLTEIKQGMIYV